MATPHENPDGGIRMIHAVFQNIRPDEEPVVA